jgi:hypothetical protein
VTGVEPNARAAELAAQACAEVHHGDLESWLRTRPSEPFDAVILSDVLEHVADPVGFLRALGGAAPLRGAMWIISVPNYGVWYNRLRTLGGKFEYDWSGLYDRTHLRFYTRRSIRALLEYCGFEVVADRASSSLVQSMVPLLRRFFTRDVADGNHLALLDNPAYRMYRRLVEPTEVRVCQVWPELLGFQIVSVAHLRG